MTYATPGSENSVTSPEKIIPVKASFSATDSGFQYTFKQNSINIFHLFPQSALLQMDNATFTIPENSGTGFSAGTMIAAGGSNYKYSIHSASLKDAFEINEKTGEITVKDSSLLNYEVTPTVVLTIAAMDILNDTLPPARGTCTINLTDANEKPHLINSKYYAFTNDSPGESIGKVFIMDEDQGQGHFYSIPVQSESDVLEIDPATGELVIAGNADLQTLASKIVAFTVSVADSGRPSLTDEKEYTLEILEEPLPVVVHTANLIRPVEVYPNPAGNAVNVAVPYIKGILLVNLADSQGKIIRSWNTSPGMATFDTSGLSDGIYSIQILSDGRVIGTQNLVLLK